MTSISLASLCSMVRMRREIESNAAIRAIWWVTTVAVSLSVLAIRTTAEENQNAGKHLPAMRADHPPTIDGCMDDLCWEAAPKAMDFVDPLSGIHARERTIARILYDDRAIYVAVYAYDSQPRQIVARQTKDQTRFSGDDTVAFSVDPFHTHRFADRNFFVVNPLWTKLAHLAAGRAEKTEWIGLWKAAAKVTEDGWSAEMEIPWRMLAYPDAKQPIIMGINFDRFQQRTGEKSWWSNVGVQEFYEYDGHWLGVMPPLKTRDVKILPYAYLALNDTPDKMDLDARAGMDLRYAVTRQLALVGTANPDFGNIEQAVKGIDFSYGARFVPDRRPFFLEGRNVLRLWEFYHSRQIGEIDAGLSLFGKVGNCTSAGALGTFHRDEGHSLLLRTSHSPSTTTNLGAAYLAHRDDSGANNMAFLEGETRFGMFSGGANFAQTWDQGILAGRQMRSNIACSGSRFSVSLSPFFIDPDFVNRLGFHPFVGIRGGRAYATIRDEWRTGILRRASVYASGEISNLYDGGIFRRTLRVSGGLETHSDHALSVGWDGGRFEEYNDGAFSIGIRGRASDQFTNYGISCSWGTRADKPYSSARISAGLRAQDLTSNLVLHLVEHDGMKRQHILTINYDFSPALSLGGRSVWQESSRNVYFALRRSGYAGTDFFVILGDPNAESFQRRFVAKVMKAF